MRETTTLNGDDQINPVGQYSCSKPSPARERSFSYQRNYASGLGQGLDRYRVKSRFMSSHEIKDAKKKS